MENSYTTILTTEETSSSFTKSITNVHADTTTTMTLNQANAIPAASNDTKVPPVASVLINSTAETKSTTAAEVDKSSSWLNVSWNAEHDSKLTQGGGDDAVVPDDQRKENSGLYWMSMASLLAANASTEMLFPDKVSKLLQRDDESLNVENAISSDDDYTYDCDWTQVPESDIPMKTVNHRIRQTITPEYKKTCVANPRVLFGAVNSTQEEVRRGAPAPLQEHAKQPLHYGHSARVNAPENGPAKSVLDVRYAPQKRMYSVQAVAGRRHCSSSGVKETHLVIYHYVGSWEYYTARDDAHRGKDHNHLPWKLKAQVAHVQNVDMV